MTLYRLIFKTRSISLLILVRVQEILAQQQPNTTRLNIGWSCPRYKSLIRGKLPPCPYIVRQRIDLIALFLWNPREYSPSNTKWTDIYISSKSRTRGGIVYDRAVILLFVSYFGSNIKRLKCISPCSTPESTDRIGLTRNLDTPSLFTVFPAAFINNRITVLVCVSRIRSYGDSWNTLID